MTPRDRIGQWYITSLSYTVVSLESCLLHTQYIYVIFLKNIFYNYTTPVYFSWYLCCLLVSFFVIISPGFHANLHSTFKYVFCLIFFIKSKCSNRYIFKFLLMSQWFLSIQELQIWITVSEQKLHVHLCSYLTILKIYSLLQWKFIYCLLILTVFTLK